MFASGNGTERMRVGRFDCAGETIVDLYAGIGYFTVPYLKHAVRINPFIHPIHTSSDSHRFDCAGETIVDLYAGIGYCTVPYLKHAVSVSYLGFVVFIMHTTSNR